MGWLFRRGSHLPSHPTFEHAETLDARHLGLSRRQDIPSLRSMEPRSADFECQEFEFRQRTSSADERLANETNFDA